MGFRMFNRLSPFRRIVLDNRSESKQERILCDALPS